MHIVCMNISHILLKSEWLGKSTFWEGPVVMGGFTKQIPELFPSGLAQEMSLARVPGEQNTLWCMYPHPAPPFTLNGECYNRRKSCFHVFLARIWSEDLGFEANLSQFPLCSFLVPHPGLPAMEDHLWHHFQTWQMLFQDESCFCGSQGRNILMPTLPRDPSDTMANLPLICCNKIRLLASFLRYFRSGFTLCESYTPNSW